MYIRKTKSTIWSSTIIDEKLTDHDKYVSIQTKSMIRSWMIIGDASDWTRWMKSSWNKMRDMIKDDIWGNKQLIKSFFLWKQNAPIDLEQLPVNETKDRNENTSKKPIHFYDHVWLSIKRTTYHDGFKSNKPNEWYDRQ